MPTAMRWAMMAMVIKAISNSNDSHKNGKLIQAMMHIVTRGQVLRGASELGQPTVAGGQAHGGDRE